MPQRLHIDFETFSEIDLNDVGAYRYAFDPSTEILCAAMAIDDEPPCIWTMTGDWQGDVERCFDALENPEVLVYAFNAQFEIAISSALMWKTWGVNPPHLARWRCAMSIARRAALPGSLEKLGDALNLTTVKDKVGKGLIKRFCMMQKAKDATLKKPAVPAHRIYPQDDPKAFHDFCEYCKTDVIVERSATKLLSYFDEPINNANYTLHETINARGVAVNLDALRHAQLLIDEESELVGLRFRNLVGFEYTQNKVLLAWLHSQGCHLDNLQAETIETFLDEHETETCKICNGAGEIDETDGEQPFDYWVPCPSCKSPAVQALRMKQSVAYVSIKKVQTMLDCAGPNDNRIRGMLNHHGATTGRSTNSLVQFQNMKRPAGHLAAETSKGSGITWSEVAYKAICDGISRDDLELFFGPVLEVISSCIRHFVHDV